MAAKHDSPAARRRTNRRPPTSQELSRFPAELLDAVRDEAEASADRVAAFLHAAGWRPGQPLRCSEEGLLALDAALRLLDWETRGITAHRAAGLPDAESALDAAVESLLGRTDGTTLRRTGVAVLAVFAERMAWGAGRELAAQVELGEADDEALVEALVNLIYNTRG